MGVLNRLQSVIYNKIRHQIDQVSKKSLNKKNFRDFHENNSKNSNSDDHNKKLKKMEQDLHIFGLTPPSSLKEIKEKRNELFQQYHPDRYHGSLEKEKIAKEMIQIYQEVYQRLESEMKKE